MITEPATDSIAANNSAAAFGGRVSLDLATLVIGYGNDLRCDDGAGIRAATLIAAQSPNVRVIITRQLTPDLAHDIALAAGVVFIDAYAASETGARLRVERISASAAKSVTPLAHHASPAALVHLADALFRTRADAWVVGIPAYRFDAGETISPETLQRIAEAVALIGEHARSGDWKGESK